MKVEASIVIDRSPDDVFAFLAVRDNDPVWMSAVVESEWLDPSARLAVCRRGRMALKMFGRRTEYVDEVAAFEPGRQIAHRTIEGPFQLNTACLCEPDGRSCRTTVAAEAERMFGSVIDPLVARLMRRGFRKDLARLKSILEATTQDPPATTQVRTQP
jgi:hypothetical protein